MLRELLSANRSEIIDRCRARVAARLAPGVTEVEIQHVVPLFYDFLVANLGGAAPVVRSTPGRNLLSGLTVAHVVHHYIDLCQTIRDVADERGVVFDARDQYDLNACLDQAVAGVVTDFGRLSSTEDTDRATRDLGFLSHELRNLLCTAALALDTMRAGAIGVESSTGAVLERCIGRMTKLVDRTLAAVRLNAGIGTHEHIAIGELMEEIEVSAMLEAKARGHRLVVEGTEPAAIVDGDRQILASILSNLVQNAFKYTEHGDVVIRSSATADRVRIEVEDRCGGLPAGVAATLFEPYQQRGADRSGLGLGLAICLRGVSALRGTLAVRDIPGTGCVFTVELPRVVNVP
ncbi:MAG TPA: HAMP domain-containing sensor histidine kinase [Kofleriaceae bacterium]|nr:HAMP domain-containing sensor histidine kinase [Kofleriaceae bacterium]